MKTRVVLIAYGNLANVPTIRISSITNLKRKLTQEASQLLFVKDILIMTNKRMISEYMASMHPNCTIARGRSQYNEILNDTTSAGWGGKPQEINGFSVVWLQFSPEHKGDKPFVAYDYKRVS
jgi:hypothetical protein